MINDGPLMGVVSKGDFGNNALEVCNGVLLRAFPMLRRSLLIFVLHLVKRCRAGSASALPDGQEGTVKLQ
jgi:hypothetical protein